MKILLPTGVPLDVDLPDGVVGVPYDPREPVPAEHEDAEALVVWTNRTRDLADAARRLTRLRWVQTLAAGPDQALAAGFGPDVVVTSGRGLHDRTVAEHTLALVLAAARRLHVLVRAQDERRWEFSLGGPQPVHEPDAFRTLRDARVTVWGYGSIARTLSPLLRALGAEVTGVARSARTEDGVPVVAEADVDELLARTDVLIMILPATDATRHALDGRRMRLLPRHAWVVNVGRGATLDEAALVETLTSGHLGGAALDVFETEPLPADSPLWGCRDVVVTPHAAGGRPLGAGELVSHNVRALVAGEPLRNVVER